MSILGPDGEVVRAVEGTPDPSTCNHGIEFDPVEAAHMEWHEVRKRFPRLGGKCPLGCGYVGIYYASALHYISGDW